MYSLSKEDKNILTNYRNFMQEQVSTTNNEQLKEVLNKSIHMLSGEITSETLKNYLEENVKKNHQEKDLLSEETKKQLNDIRVAAANYGVMDVVKRFKQG